MEIIQEPQSNIEEKGKPRTLKDDFPQEQTHRFRKAILVVATYQVPDHIEWGV